MMIRKVRRALRQGGGCLLMASPIVIMFGLASLEAGWIAWVGCALFVALLGLMWLGLCLFMS